MTDSLRLSLTLLTLVAAAVAAAAPAARPAGGPVLTQILGTCLDYSVPPLDEAIVERALTDLTGQGFAMSWDASPAPWTRGLLENRGQLEYCKAMAARLVRHGMGAVFVFPWDCLLPLQPTPAQRAWTGEALDPATGAIAADAENPRWNFGSEAARSAFAARARALFAAVGPFQMYFNDEQVIASPGGNEPYVNRMSTYWTSPTYSREALGTVAAPGSFRHYLGAKGYPGAATARFPVTTVAVAPGPNANMGLPAVPLNAGNADRLQADNGWPDSPLWKHWYGWRTEVYKQWVDSVMTAAHDTWSRQPNWQGCAFGAPYYWYDPALGLDVDKIASVRHVDFVVAGYFSGTNFQRVKAAALKHGKRWGGMVELSHYGAREGVAPQVILDTFKANVEAGASLMLAYAGASFRTDRPQPDSNGLYHMPAQVAAWQQCVQWLQSGRGLKRVVPQP